MQAVQVELFQLLAAAGLLGDLAVAEAEYLTQGVVAIERLGIVDLAEILVFLEKIQEVVGCFSWPGEYSMSLKMMIAQEMMENDSSSSRTSLTTVDAFWIR